MNMLRVLILAVAILSCGSVLAQEPPDKDEPRECRATGVRGPLIWARGGPYRGKAFEEGYRILLDVDSYPRRPARLVAGPSVEEQDDGYRVTFALDRFDDVLVRVMDAHGEVVRNLGCGVLGPNAPEPFEAGALDQELHWDGLNAQGKPAPDGCRLEVSVGLSPRFERFVGYDPGQLTNFLSGLTVDHRGRVYVALHTSLRFDPVMLRFNRDGRYMDMVYPSDPAALKARGQKMADVYQPVEMFEGRQIPIKESVWRYWIQRWEDYMKFPFRIGPDGTTGYFVVGTPTKIEQLYTIDGADARIFTMPDLDDFWWQPWNGPWHYAPVFIWRWDAAFALDREGYLYVGTNNFDGNHGDYAIGDYGALGTVRKVDPATGQNLAVFTHNGTQKRSEPGEYLGTKATVLEEKQLEDLARFLEPGAPVPERDPRDSDHSFFDMEDLAVDGQGNILVADGHPRRIKCYAPNGRWLGEVTGLPVGGQHRKFLDLANVFWANDALYVLSTFRGEPTNRMHLLKCIGRLPDYEVAWSVPLDPLARFIAVDTWAETPLVWVGNGGGVATITRIEDYGDSAGPLRHFGGIGERTIAYPGTIAAGKGGHLFAYDHTRSQVIHTNDQGTIWKTADVPRNRAHWNAAVHRTTKYKDPHHRNRDVHPRSMVVDEDRERLLVSFRSGGTRDPLSPGFQAYDFDMEPLDFTLEQPADAAGQKIRGRRAARWPWDTNVEWGAVFGGFDAEGNLYVTPLNWIRSANIPEELPGVVWKYGPDGKLRDRAHVRYYLSAGNLTVDSTGSVYVHDVGHLPPAKAQYDFPDMTWGYWRKAKPMPKGPYLMHRGSEPVTHISELCHVVKFGPEGGVRYTADEAWAHRGGSVHIACGGCDFAANLLDSDGADRILSADAAHYCVNVLDTSGNLIGRFGTYGNAATVPADGDADDLGFRNIYGISAAGDAVYVSDKDLRRVAKVRMEYRETAWVDLP